MNRTDGHPEEVLDVIAGEIRAEQPEARTVAESAQRVWGKLSSESQAITGCDQFRALFPLFRAGTLTEARRLLVEDHLHRCVDCRRSYYGVIPIEVPDKLRPARRMGVPRWAIAATLLIGVGLGTWLTWDNLGPAPGGSRGRVLAAQGAIYKLRGGSLTPAAAGGELAEGEILRTAGDARTSLKLLDGSVVEVGPRAELFVTAGRKDTTVHLTRGQIIVEAAKRRTGHLYVASADSRVAVTGTVFSVNRGLAGSRVSVIEGEVQLQHGNEKNVLHAGDQVSTHPSIGRTLIREEVSWSSNYDQYLSVLKNLAEIKGKLASVQMPGLRYQSRLMDSVPESAGVYISVPNLGPAIHDLQRIVNDQARQSPELKRWMDTQLPHFEKITSHLTSLGQYLGDEIVLTSGRCEDFCGVLIAETTRPGLREYVEGELAKAGADLHGLKIVYSGNKVIAGEDAAMLQAAQHVGQGGGSRFSQTPFGQTIANVYARGAGLFAAANLEGMGAGLPVLGIDKVRYFLAEQKEVNGKTESSAAVTFAGDRQGVASWLAAPGSMGSLNFISPDAQFAAAFVVKQPAGMLKDVIAMGGAYGPSKRNFDQWEQEYGLNIDQFASSLGGEVAFALDGPLIPSPSWKFIAEVRNSAALQSTIERLAQGNAVVSAESYGGQTFHSLKVSPGEKTVSISWVYSNGYLIAAPTRALLERTLRDGAAGLMLTRSRQFTSLLPRDSRANLSGVVYQNAGDLLRTLAQGTAAGNLVSNLEPALVCLYGQKDRIEIASQGNAINLLLQTLAGRLGVGRSPKPGTQTTALSYR